MAHEEIQILDDLIEKHQPEICLEWGSGGSTIYFPNKHDCIKRWVSIEHDYTWVDALKSQMELNKSVDLRHGTQEDGLYLNWAMDMKFDFILIDGIMRLECMAFASTYCMNPGAIVVLHDSGRAEYKDGYEFFDHYLELAPGVGEGKDGGADFRGLTMFWND